MCKCYVTYINISPYTSRDASPCMDKDQIKCMLSNCDLLAVSLENNCTECRTKCTKTSFSTTVSSGSFSSGNWINFLNRSLFLKNGSKYLSNSDIQKRMTCFNIYFEDLKYTNYTQIPKMTISQLVSSIGGYLGILLGASILTVIEILEISLMIISAFIKKRINQKKKNSNSA